MHIIFICIEAILMGAPYAIPTIPPLLGAVMFWAGVAGLIVYPTILLLKNRQLPFLGRSNFVTLTEAGRLLYELASDKLKEDIRGFDKNGEEIEGTAKQFILIAGAQKVIDLRGRRGHGLVREIIPADELENLFVTRENGDDIGTLPFDVDYVDVAIRRSDIKKVIRHFTDSK